MAASWAGRSVACRRRRRRCPRPRRSRKSRTASGWPRARSARIMLRMSELKMQTADLEAFIAREFPQAAQSGAQIERLEPGALRMRLGFNDDYLRPGGTLSGPTLMALADRATYLLILAMIGPVALAVTTNLNISFLS